MQVNVTEISSTSFFFDYNELLSRKFPCVSDDIWGDFLEHWPTYFLTEFKSGKP